MDVLKRLTSLQPPYLHLFVSIPKKLTQLVTLLNQASHLKHIVTIINGDKCQTSDALFGEFATMYEFPNYFGDTWDSLDECLNDLSWLPAEAYILLIKNFDKALTNSAHDKTVLIDILIKTAIAWAQGQHFGALTRKPTPFHIVLHCTEHQDEIVQLLKQAKLTECKNPEDS